MTAHVSRIAGTTLLVFFALAGCGGGDEAPADEMAMDEMEMAAETEESEGAGEVEVELLPLPDFQADGTLTLTRSGDELRAYIEADSRLGPGDYLFMIHQGTCEERGAPVVTLTTMTGAEGGDGMSETDFAASQLPLDGTYFLMMSRSDGTPIACGDFPSLEGF